MQRLYWTSVSVTPAFLPKYPQAAVRGCVPLSIVAVAPLY